jgi:hypothetical protein
MTQPRYNDDFKACRMSDMRSLGIIRGNPRGNIKCGSAQPSLYYPFFKNLFHLKIMILFWLKINNIIESKCSWSRKPPWLSVNMFWWLIRQSMTFVRSGFLCMQSFLSLTLVCTLSLPLRSKHRVKIINMILGERYTNFKMSYRMVWRIILQTIIFIGSNFVCQSLIRIYSMKHNDITICGWVNIRQK